MGEKVRYLNLLAIRLPLPGVLSILHRVSGVALLAALPFALAALQWSIGSREEYDALMVVLAHPAVKFCVWGGGWAFFHHLCAGVRFLFLDVHVGVGLVAARRSAAVAFVVSLFLTLVWGVWLW